MALWLAKGISLFIDLFFKGRGTNLPGAIALKLDPQFLSHIRGISPERTVFITGTNGKSTATNLLYHLMTRAGLSVASNLDGANMTPGVAVPLLKNCTLTGKFRCDYAVMETDERYVALIRKQLPAKYLCVTNIQKDQVQRNGEPSFIYDKIRQAIHPDMTLFLNHDDPNTLSLPTEGRVIPYGVAAHSRSFHKQDTFFSVSMPCPKCHGALVFQQYNLDNVGLFHCPVCGFSNEQAPEYFIDSVSFSEKTFTMDGQTYPFRCNSPEFLYSYALAMAVAKEFSIDDDTISRALDSFESKRSHNDQLTLAGRKLDFLRIKQENSETLQSALNVIATDTSEKTLIFGLDEYIDFYPPYLNTCYMFDCDFRALRDSGVGRWACTSKGLGHLGALRLLYDGFDPEKMAVLPGSSEADLTKALEDCPQGSVYLVEEIPYFNK